jgi:hypothetical protein
MSDDNETTKKVETYIAAFRRWRLDPDHVDEPGDEMFDDMLRHVYAEGLERMRADIDRLTPRKPTFPANDPRFDGIRAKIRGGTFLAGLNRAKSSVKP